MLASINGVDISANVQDSTYHIDEIDVCDTWVDASEKNHERIYRTRVKGSFELVYITEGSGIQGLYTLIEGASTGRVLRINVFVNNKCKIKEINCHYKIDGIKRVDLKNGLYYDRFKMTLEEV